MSLPPGPTPSPDLSQSTETIGLPPMKRPMVQISIDWSQLPNAVTALGVSLVSAAVVLSAAFSRRTSDLDGSNFTMGVLATLGLLGVSAAAAILQPRFAHGSALVSWSGAAGVLGTGLMLAVLIDDDPAALYVGASVIVAMSVAGYYATRSAPFVLSTITGLAFFYGQVFSDVIDPSGDGSNTFMIVGAAIVVFVVAVTAVGWLLPDTRVLSGIVVGAGGLAAMSAVFQAVMVFGAFRSFGSSTGFASDGPVPDAELGSDGGFTSLASAIQHNPYENDVYVMLTCCGVLAALWIACSLATGHVGYRILVLVTAVMSVPMAAVSLYVNHPTWWEVAACGLGGAILVGGAYLSMRRSGPTVEPAAR